MDLKTQYDNNLKPIVVALTNEVLDLATKKNTKVSNDPNLLTYAQKDILKTTAKRFMLSIVLITTTLAIGTFTIIKFIIKKCVQRT